MITRELMLEKGDFGLWRVCDGAEECFRITDDGGGYCNSIEEMCRYYNGDEIGLVKQILQRGNNVIFADHGESYGKGEYSYEEYLSQFEKSDGDYIIFPYVDFDTYEKAKEIFDLLNA